MSWTIERLMTTSRNPFQYSQSISRNEDGTRCLVYSCCQAEEMAEESIRVLLGPRLKSRMNLTRQETKRHGGENRLSVCVQSEA